MTLQVFLCEGPCYVKSASETSIMRGPTQLQKVYEVRRTEIWSKNRTKPSYKLVQAVWKNCSANRTIHIAICYQKTIPGSDLVLMLLAQGFNACFADTEAKS